MEKDVNNLIVGMSREEYNRKATSHSKANIFLWTVGGIVFNIFRSNLFSISTLLLIIPGIFIISFASIPTFYIEAKKYQIIPKTKNVFIFLLFSIWYLIDIIYPVVLGIVFILLIEYLFKLF